MSMYLPFGKFEQSTEMLQAPGASFTAEGQAVVRQAGASPLGVVPSTGQASDIFCGFAIAGTSALPFPEPSYTKVETFLVPATGAVTLSMTPVSNADVGVYDLTTGSAVASPTINGAKVSGLTAGDQVQVTYKYDLTPVQRRALFGDVQPGGYVGDTIGQIGVVTRGTVYTAEFDHSVDWTKFDTTTTAPNKFVMVAKANGQVGLADSATNTAAVIPGYIVSLPTQDVPFLGITFSAP